MITLNEDYSTKPEGYRDARETYSGNSSPIIVGPCPVGNMGRAFYKASGQYYPGVLIQRFGSVGDDGRKPLPPSRVARLEQDVWLHVDGPERSLGNIMVWYNLKPAGQVFLASYFQVAANCSVFAWIHYYAPPTPGQQQGMKTIRREFKAVADDRIHRMSNTIDAEKVTLTLDAETVTISIPELSRFSTFNLCQYYVGNLFTGLCNREIGETSEVPDRTPQEQARIDALIAAGVAWEAEEKKKDRDKMRSDKLAARKAAADKAREEARRKRESGM